MNLLHQLFISKKSYLASQISNKMTKTKKVLQKILFFIISLAIGGLIGYWIGGLIKSNAFYIPENSIWILALSIFPLYLLAIAIHEGGHAVAGVSQKFDFTMYVAGPLMFEKANDQWVFKWNKSFNLAGGLVLCLPKDTYNLVNRFLVFVISGPLASLLSALVSFGIYKIIGGSDESNSFVQNAIAILLLVYTFLSVLVFIITIIPMSANGFHTDGARVLRLIKGGNIGKLESLILTIISKVMGGIRPKDYNMEEITEAKNLAMELKDSYEVYLDGFLFQHAFDKNDIEAAENHLTNYLANIEKMPDGFRGSIWLDAAFFYAYAKKDIEKANQYFSLFKPSPMIPKAQEYATEAAILYLKNDIGQMNNKIEQSLALNNTLMDKGIAKAMKERLEGMKLVS
jgi:hypothetical protein